MFHFKNYSASLKRRFIFTWIIIALAFLSVCYSNTEYWQNIMFVLLAVFVVNMIDLIISQCSD
jgi:phosphatidylglycerophosphate synthase